MATKEWRAKNRDKMNAYQQKYYAKNSAEQVDRIAKRREILREWLSEFKSQQSCNRCGENHPATLQFHHKDPKEKDVSISQAINSLGWSIERIKKEMDKCEILCANCHFKEHYNGDIV